ncbi:hypothetical protein [Hymenobacter guriensis]|uniref:TraB/GumN family protein n=1 Tax=Hymenobacter guriensis TaxID=2793065 RepID=A0ABS0L7N0_9BACT|nr:hypothetical protein [Hymenobacter guriensis]MBG8555945.1 hypothetical protein [Hymenobacter guriensis]
MKNLWLWLLIGLLSGGRVAAQTPESVGPAAPRIQVVIVGTVHKATRRFTPDSVARILQRVQPDLILVELDSSFFTADFELRRPSRENEALGVALYRQQHPVPMRPFDYEGRNDFHRQHGLLTKPGEVLALLDGLYKQRRLTPAQGTILDRYYQLTDSANRTSARTPYAINQPAVYALIARRQHMQYQELNAVVQARPELAEYHAFYQLNADFWDTRNQAMAAHILTHIRQHRAQRIVVLVGHFHKYYLLRELAARQQAEGFELREYYSF